MIPQAAQGAQKPNTPAESGVEPKHPDQPVDPVSSQQLKALFAALKAKWVQR